VEEVRCWIYGPVEREAWPTLILFGSFNTLDCYTATPDCLPVVPIWKVG